METTETLRNMVDDILADRSNDAVNAFNAAMGFKLSSALDTKKQEIAASIGQETEENEEV
jgi:hypothetical protein